MHTTQAVDTQKPSVSCSFKESSHGQSFDSLSPNNRQTGPQKVTASPWIRWNKNIRFKGFLHFRNGSFPLCFSLLFSSKSVPYLLWPLLELLINYRISYKMCSCLQKQKTLKDNSSVSSHPILGFSCAWSNQEFVGFSYNLVFFSLKDFQLIFLNLSV